MPRGRNRRSRKEDTHDRSPGQPARHSARLTHLTVAGEYIHAPVRTGMVKGRKQICSNLKLPRHTSTLHPGDVPTDPENVCSSGTIERYGLLLQIPRSPNT